MNVVQRDKCPNPKIQPKPKNGFVRKDSSLGIRGATLPSSLKPFTIAKAILAPNKTPRYQFRNDDNPTICRRPSMGPPTGLPKTLKRRIIQSASSKPESSSSGKGRPRVLASDSAPADTSNDFCTPQKTRPTVLRYISSSSRGHTGTRSAMSTSISAAEPSVILAISEGRGLARGEIGMAAIDLKHPHLVLCQFSDTLLYTHTLTKINYFNPIEIIVPHTFCEGVQPNQLYQIIKDQYPLLNITTVQRRHFNDAAGRQHIQTLCAPQYSAVYLQVLQKFYAVTAAAAVLKYVEYIQCIVFARESLKIEYHSSENTMIIDIGTASQLELVQPLVPSAGPTCCLLGVLGPTYTIGGIRALRAAILQPSCNKDFIESRLDAVQDLIENDSGLMVDLQVGNFHFLTMTLDMNELEDVIKKLSDIDKILFLCMDTSNQNIDKIGEAQLNQTLLLKTTMDVVPNLVEALGNAVSGRLRKIKMDLETPNYKEITVRIKTIIQDDAHLEKGAMGSLQRCFAVRPEINGLLDVARRTYSELIEDIQKIVEQLSETYDLPLRLNQNVMKGFHIVMAIAPKNRRSFNVEKLPPIFIQVNNNGASVSMSTEELVVLDQQAKESLNEIQKMSNIVISGLLKELRPFMPSLYTLCENVAELDVLLAMAQASSAGSYIRPEFNSYLDIRNSVHPLLDYNSQVMPVPNDIFASSEHNFTIITGPNMGGKSIYIKQIAIMHVMAQLGCFLPATNAVLRLCDRIFSRIGFNDSVELNASTYVFEMKEIQHIIKGLTSSSLVIIDELCRGTCADEGTSIAWAICEELIMSDAFTFFTTHFIYLTRLQELYFNVVNCHTAVTEEERGTEDSQKRLVYHHKIEPGVTKIEHYGLSLAATTNLPEDTVKLAIELAELIGRNNKVPAITTLQKTDDEILYKLNSNIRQEVRKHGNSEEVIRTILRRFKEEHPQIIERIKVERNRINNRTDSSAYDSSAINHSKQRTTSNDDVSINYLSNNLIANNTQNNMAHDSLISTNLDTIDDNAKQYDSHINYASVRSSDQLLNSVLNNAQESCEENEMKNVMDVDMIDCNPNSIDNATRNDYTRENAPILKENENIFTRKINNFDATENNYSDVGNDSSMKEDDFIEQDDALTDSEVEDDQTQIVEQYSSSNEAEVEENSDVISVDEELVTETIYEINVELLRETAGVENIVLTPPMEFRDL